MVNPITNPKTNTEMTDFKSVLKSNIQSVELNKKKVKITCHNKNAGNKVITTLSQNVSLFGSNNYDVKKGIDGAKDFNIKYDGKNGKAEAETFYNNIIAIITDPNVTTGEAEKSAAEKAKEAVQNAVDNAVNTAKQAMGIPPAPEATPTSGAAPTATPTPAPTPAPGATAVPAAPGGGSEDSEGSDKTMLYAGIGGAVLLVIIIGLVIWKSKK